MPKHWDGLISFSIVTSLHLCWWWQPSELPRAIPYASEALEGLLADLRRKYRLRVIEPGPLDRSQTLELASKILKREIGDSMQDVKIGMFETLLNRTRLFRIPS